MIYPQIYTQFFHTSGGGPVINPHMWRSSSPPLRVYNGSMQPKRVNAFTLSARILIGIVTLLNLQAAFQFMFWPSNYAPGFEISGEAGIAVIQGMGLLFLMWNIPYLFALTNPVKRLLSLIEAVIMQAIGVIGETVLLLTLKGEHPQIHASVLRFIIFDGAGLVLLLIALSLVIRFRRSRS